MVSAILLPPQDEGAGKGPRRRAAQPLQGMAVHQVEDVERVAVERLREVIRKLDQERGGGAIGEPSVPRARGLVTGNESAALQAVQRLVQGTFLQVELANRVVRGPGPRLPPR